MVLQNSDIWQSYSKFVLNFEGKLSNDPDDSAAACVKAGQYHTNRGVTFCFFKDRAAALNILPVTYDRFVNLTDDDARKFMYDIYVNSDAAKLGDYISLAITELTWAAGSGRSQKTLIKAVNNFGYKVKTYKDALKIAETLDEIKLFKEYDKLKIAFFEYLINAPSKKWYKYRNGWRRRYKDFSINYSPEKKKFVNSPKTNTTPKVTTRPPNTTPIFLGFNPLLLLIILGTYLYTKK
jgi:lysozyme family protein